MSAKFPLVGVAALALVSCGGGDSSSPPPSAGTVTTPPPSPTPSPSPSPSPPPSPTSITTTATFEGEGTTFTGQSTGTQVMRILVIRSDFDDSPHRLDNQAWNDMLIARLTALQNYLNRYAYNQFRVEATISSSIRHDSSADFFDLLEANDLFRATYRALAVNSQENSLASLDNAEHVIHSYSSIPHNVAGGAFGFPGTVWWPIEDPSSVHDGGFVHEFGHSLGMPHSFAMEGAPFGSASSTHTELSEDLREGHDGLHMMGSDGDGRIGFLSSYPMPYSLAAGLIPERFASEITTSGTYRIYDFETEDLPSGDEKFGFWIAGPQRNSNNFPERYWLSFAPDMSARWANFDPIGFRNGLIIHREFNRSGFGFSPRLAVVDFSPDSHRTANGFATSRSTYEGNLFRDTRDGSLQLGASFSVPGSGATVTPMGVGMNAEGVRYIDVAVTGL